MLISGTDTGLWCVMFLCHREMLPASAVHKFGARRQDAAGEVIWGP